MKIIRMIGFSAANDARISAWNKAAFALAMAAASPALAQQSTAIDRVSVSLGQCVGSVEQRIDEIAVLKKQLAVAQAKIQSMEKPVLQPKE